MLNGTNLCARRASPSNPWAAPPCADLAEPGPPPPSPTWPPRPPWELYAPLPPRVGPPPLVLRPPTTREPPAPPAQPGASCLAGRRPLDTGAICAFMETRADCESRFAAADAPIDGVARGAGAATTAGRARGARPCLWLDWQRGCEPSGAPCARLTPAIAVAPPAPTASSALPAAAVSAVVRLTLLGNDDAERRPSAMRPSHLQLVGAHAPPAMTALTGGSSRPGGEPPAPLPPHSPALGGLWVLLAIVLSLPAALAMRAVATRRWHRWSRVTTVDQDLEPTRLHRDHQRDHDLGQDLEPVEGEHAAGAQGVEVTRLHAHRVIDRMHAAPSYDSEEELEEQLSRSKSKSGPSFGSSESALD